MSDEKSQEPGGGRLLPGVQQVEDADADVICPKCHQRMVKEGGKAHGFPADLKNAEYIRGGSDHLDNLQLLCGACNSMKGTLSQEAFIAKLKAEGLR